MVLPPIEYFQIWFRISAGRRSRHDSWLVLTLYYPLALMEDEACSLLTLVVLTVASRHP